MDKFKPMKEADYKKLTPAQKKAYDAKAKKAMVDNLPNAADKARQAELDKEFGTYTNMPDTPRKMMKAGGMAKKPKAKARGYGMARGGKVCKMR